MGNKFNCCKGNEGSDSKCCGCFNCKCDCCEGRCNFCKCDCCEGGCNFCQSCSCSSKKRNQNIYQIAPSTEKQITKYKYSSTFDPFYDEIEGKYNILTYIQLINYINLLKYYSLETATLKFNRPLKTQFSPKDSFLSQPISVDHFQSFIENHLFKIPEIYEMSAKNEFGFSIFKTVILEVHKSLELKLNQHYGETIENRIRKRNLVPLGILYCVSNVVSKIKLIFDLHKNENGLFVKSNELNEYLISSFLIASYCIVSARNKISAHSQLFPGLTKDELIQMIQVSELKDSQNLVNVFNNSFFDKEALTWEEYRNKFEDINGFQWILSSNGIRKKLIENNV